MDDREFFDRLAPQWDANEVLSTPEKVRYIINFFDIKPGMSVLDLGTGTGVLLPYIAEKTGPKGEITAVDYSEGMLGRARTKYSDLTPAPNFMNLDIENETIPGEYDRIILYCVYPHLHNPAETLKWLQTVNLKPDGAIFIAFPCNEDFINNIHKERHSDSDILCPANELALKLRREGLNAKVSETDPDTYIIKITK